MSVVGTVVSAVRVALSLRAAVPYVAAAYLAFVALVAIYVAIMAHRQRRCRREVAELAGVARGCFTAAAPRAETQDVAVPGRQP